MDYIIHTHSVDVLWTGLHDVVINVKYILSCSGPVIGAACWHVGAEGIHIICRQ